jgi:hypothetical protein
MLSSVSETVPFMSETQILEPQVQIVVRFHTTHSNVIQEPASYTDSSAKKTDVANMISTVRVSVSATLLTRIRHVLSPGQGAPPISAGQREVQFCTLLRVFMSLYDDSKNLNTFTASLHLQ